MTNFLDIVQDDRGLLTITFNRPDALNALLPDMLEAVATAANEAKANGVRVIVIEGRGRAFCSGVDLKTVRGVKPHNGRISDTFDVPGVAAATALRTAGIPVIAKVHGACFTGALELALSCDMIFCTQDTKFGETHAKFGLRPTWGMTEMLTDAIGLRRAKEFSFTARVLRANEAYQWGLVNAVAEDKAALDALVDERVSQILACSAGSVEAYVDLYEFASEPKLMELGITQALARDYDCIDDDDTAERLSGFI